MSITKTLRQLNWHKGRGEVTHIRFDKNDRTQGTVYRRVPVTQHTFFTETRRFSVKGNTVRAFGGSATI